jgi:hypothetical protein
MTEVGGVFNTPPKFLQSHNPSAICNEMEIKFLTTVWDADEPSKSCTVNMMAYAELIIAIYKTMQDSK